jgi:hypothetical protein
MRKGIIITVVLIIIIAVAAIIFLNTNNEFGPKPWLCEGDLNNKVTTNIEFYIEESDNILILNNGIINQGQGLGPGEKCNIPFATRGEKEEEISFKVEKVISEDLALRCGTEFIDWAKEEEKAITFYEDGLGYDFIEFNIPEDTPYCSVNYNLMIYKKGMLFSEKRFIVNIA